MIDHKTLVLNHRQIQQKITRMAYEIYERNSTENQVIFAGISGMGKILAELLANKLKEISPLEVESIEVLVDKMSQVQGEITLSENIDIENKCLILVDDVLNTGKTLAFALKPFLEIPIKKMELAVLVNRSHKLFPVSPDYTGLELSTTLNEHIAVNLSNQNYSVHLH